MRGGRRRPCGQGRSGRVPGDGDATRIPPQLGGVGVHPCQRVGGVVMGGRPRILGGQAIADRDDRGAGVGDQAGADPVGGVEVAQHEAAAVVPDHDRSGFAVLRSRCRVDPSGQVPAGQPDHDVPRGHRRLVGSGAQLLSGRRQQPGVLGAERGDAERPLRRPFREVGGDGRLQGVLAHDFTAPWVSPVFQNRCSNRKPTITGSTAISAPTRTLVASVGSWMNCPLQL